MTINEIISNGPLSFGAALSHPVTMKRGVRVAIIVGTILVAINQGDLLLDGTLPAAWKLILTYLVPYSVSSYSSAMFIVELSKNVPAPMDKGI
ncbi:MAG: nitrate/nitrite transporter NrtS [Parasphingorhabdus sp.]